MTNLSLKSSGFPAVRGRITENAALGDVGWFRCGGRADVLFKPADEDDLAVFLAGCPADIPVTVIGVMSNAIIRDGGVRGVVIRLGREFAGIEKLPDGTIRAGAAALDGNVAAFAAREVFVSTMALSFHITTEDEVTLQERLLTSMAEAKHDDGRPIFTTPVIVGLVLFFMIALQCISTVAIARREFGGWRPALVQLVVLNLLAYAVAVGVVQLWPLLG